MRIVSIRPELIGEQKISMGLITDSWTERVRWLSNNWRSQCDRGEK